jgi:hypothetical protein
VLDHEQLDRICAVRRDGGREDVRRMWHHRQPPLTLHRDVEFLGGFVFPISVYWHKSA